MRMRAGWMLGITVVAGAVSVGGASRAQAQGTGVDSTPYVRAREMVANGETEAGRHLVDSLLKAAQPGSPEFAEGLYWRAAIAASGRDAERDYRQIVVDYPTSPRVAPALLRMGQLEAARGDREASMQHFQRLVIEHPESPLRAEASYWVANSYLGKNDLQHGCTANADALEHVSAGDVELKNRIDYQQLRCRNVRLAGAAPATAAPAAAPAITAPPKPVAKTIGKPAKKPASVKKESTAVAREVPVERPAASAESTATATADSSAGASVKDSAPAAKPVTEKAAAAESSTVLPSVTKATKTTKTTKTSTTTAKSAAKATTGTTARTTTKTATKTATKTTTKSATRAEAAEAPAASTESTSTSNERGYAVQVAAYKSRVQADSLAAKLRARGWASHVDGDGAPYRVRIGHYATRAAAVTELRRLKAKKIDGFVTEP